MMRKILLCLIVLGFLLVPTDAKAARNPCDAYYESSYHLGVDNYAHKSSGTNGGTGGLVPYTKPPRDIVGTWGVLNTPPPPPVCDGDKGTVSSWTMVSPSAAVGWAQSGLIVWWGSNGWRYFSQYSPDGKGWKSVYFSWGPGVGQSHAYFQYLDPNYCGPWGCGSESIIIDSTFVDRTNFNPRVLWGSQEGAMRSSWDSETKYHNSDMPGTPSYHQTYRDMKYQSFSRGWLPAPCEAFYGNNTWGPRAASAYWNVKTGTYSLGTGSYNTCQWSDTWTAYP